ncbi:copper amine oxidase [Streptomyces sp. NPDC059637]|uniref:copper amine oxidase n=1 Tax=Streptomyces sp. NPDC059637 TaxID=3347752 RepID=UPI00369B76AF
MHASVRRLALLAAPALLVLTTGASAGPAAQAAPAAPEPAPPSATGCSAGSAIAKKLPNGTTWRMCWHNSPTAGLVLENVSYQPRHESRPIKVLASARLAQINVPYDNGAQEYNDVTSFYFGSTPEKLAPADCPGGTVKNIRVEGERPVPALCVTTQPRGFAYHGNSSDIGEDPGRTDSAQGDDLVVYVVNSVGYYHYITQWNFSDDGTVTAKEGATGNLSPADYDAGDTTGMPLGKGNRDKATSHHHNVFWRLDFDIDGSEKAKVEQWDTKPDGRSADGVARLRTTRKRLVKETAGDAAPSRWWRVVSNTGKNADGHPRSWEIVQQHTDKYAPHEYTSHDVYFTQYKGCEKYASGNREFEPRCADTVDRFVDGQELTRPVVWVNVGFHHIARDEDQAPMPVHWQGFQVAPRDVTAMSPITPDHLHDPRYNGEPRWEEGQ